MLNTIKPGIVLSVLCVTEQRIRLDLQSLHQFYGWPNPLVLVNKNSQTTRIYRVISFISSELFRGTCYFGNVWWTTISNNMWHNIMSKAILGFGVSVTRLAALAGSKLASTPSNDDIVKSPGVWTGVQNVCQNITFTMVWT